MTHRLQGYFTKMTEKHHMQQFSSLVDLNNSLLCECTDLTKKYNYLFADISNWLSSVVILSDAL